MTTPWGSTPRERSIKRIKSSSAMAQLIIAARLSASPVASLCYACSFGFYSNPATVRRSNRVGAANTRKMSDPSPGEMKTWREKQVKRDELSGMMGQYLLKGYGMLDSYCSECGVSISPESMVKQDKIYNREHVLLRHGLAILHVNNLMEINK